MTNTLVTGNIETAILKWIAPLFPQESAVEKGDLPGHEFHGNQYQDGSGTSVPNGIHTINGQDVIIAPYTNLRSANLYGANLTNVNLRSADLRNANLTGADLSDAGLHNAVLSGATLVKANLTDARLGATNLTDADLRYADLYNANLIKADLTGANLTGANLTRAYLGGANLSRANLSDANLTRADLSGANLRFTELRGAYFNGTKGDERTLLPDTHEVVDGFVVERVTKGDSLGHPFRGNQHTHGEAGSAANEAHQGAQSLLRAAENGGQHPEDEDVVLKPRDFAEIHADQSSIHRELAEKSPTEGATRAHTLASAAHDMAADAWRDPSSVFTGEALRATQSAAGGSAHANDVTQRDATTAERQDRGAANDRPTDRNGDPIVTKDSPAVQVAKEDVTPAEQSKYFNTPGEGKYIGGYGGAVTLPDGMVNPLTGEIGTGSKVSYGYDPSESHMVVQGERPGGSVFTRVIRADGGEKIGDSMSFVHDQTGRNQGYGRVIGIVEPSTGRAFGDFPNKKLSYHGYQ